MKKLVVLLLIILLCTSSAVAEINILRIDEDFQIRNGIGFNMSKDDIKVIEQQNGSVDITNSGRFDRKEPRLCYSTSLLGADAEVFFYYNENEILTDFYYSIDKSSLSNLRSSLSERYGTPLFDNKHILDAFSSRALAKYLEFCSAMSNVKLNEYIGWLIQYNDCYVYVDLMGFTYSKSPVYGLYYKIMDYDEATYAISRLEDYYDSVNQSKNNDL